MRIMVLPFRNVTECRCDLNCERRTVFVYMKMAIVVKVVSSFEVARFEFVCALYIYRSEFRRDDCIEAETYPLGRC